MRPVDIVNVLAALLGLIWSIQDKDAMAIAGFFGWFIESIYTINNRKG